MDSYEMMIREAAHRAARLRRDADEVRVVNSAPPRPSARVAVAAVLRRAAERLDPARESLGPVPPRRLA